MGLEGKGLGEVGFGLVGPALLEEQLAVGGEGFFYDDAGICACVVQDVQVDLLPFLVSLEVEASAEEVQCDSYTLELVVANGFFETEFEEEGAFIDSLKIEE